MSTLEMWTCKFCIKWKCLEFWSCLKKTLLTLDFYGRKFCNPFQALKLETIPATLYQLEAEAARTRASRSLSAVMRFCTSQASITFYSSLTLFCIHFRFVSAPCKMSVVLFWIWFARLADFPSLALSVPRLTGTLTPSSCSLEVRPLTESLR